jgi:hypothetical protein
MAKLHQIIALASGRKSRSQSELTTLYRKVQASNLFQGLDRKYRPKDDDGDQLPPESTRVQFTVLDAIRELRQIVTPAWDCVAAQDNANCYARADVVVDGQVIATGVPVTTLLYLEKQLTDLRTFVSNLPTLDPAEDWFDADAPGWSKTKPVETTRTKKVPKNHVLSEATKEHPAQVQVFTEDVIVGYWQTVKLSGAILESERAAMVGRLNSLLEAIKAARETANDTEVEDVTVASGILEYLF